MHTQNLPTQWQGQRWFLCPEWAFSAASWIRPSYVPSKDAYVGRPRPMQYEQLELAEALGRRLIDQHGEEGLYKLMRGDLMLLDEVDHQGRKRPSHERKNRRQAIRDLIETTGVVTDRVHPNGRVHSGDRIELPSNWHVVVTLHSSACSARWKSPADPAVKHIREQDLKLFKVLLHVEQCLLLANLPPDWHPRELLEEGWTIWEVFEAQRTAAKFAAGDTALKPTVTSQDPLVLAPSGRLTHVLLGRGSRPLRSSLLYPMPHGEPSRLVEMDIASAHPTFLRGIKDPDGALIMSEPERLMHSEILVSGDWYATLAPNTDRNEAKRQFQQWMAGTVYDCEMHEQLGKSFPDLANRVEKIREGGTTLQMLCQQAESRIMIRGLCVECAEKDIPIIPLHDGLMCLPMHEEFMRERLRFYVERETGVTPVIEVKGESVSDQPRSKIGLS